jgi:excisionase family DNA binding protein
MTADPWVSVDEVAKHLGVLKDSIYRWIEGWGLAAHKVGRPWNFRLPKVDAWVQTHRADDSVGARFVVQPSLFDTKRRSEP